MLVILTDAVADEGSTGRFPEVITGSGDSDSSDGWVNNGIAVLTAVTT